MFKLRLIFLMNLLVNMNLTQASTDIDYDNFDPILEPSNERILEVPVLSRPENPFSTKRTPKEHKQFKKNKKNISRSILLDSLKTGWTPIITKY